MLLSRRRASLTWRDHEPIPPRRSTDEEQHASNLELFYDLVFVLAVTQISHLLLGDLTWRGAGRSLLVLLVVWWAWNYTTWVTNVLDPDAIVVRLLVLAIMFGSLVMAVAIPEAFGSRALLFAGAYVAIQVGRHAFLTFVVADRDAPEREPALHILIWFCFSGVFWLAGGVRLRPGADRAVARRARDRLRRALRPLPGARPSRSSSRRRGTSRARTSRSGSSCSSSSRSASRSSSPARRRRSSRSASPALTAFGLAFLITAAFWWLYFSYVATIAQRRLELASDRTTVARNGYTYLHVVLVAGIIVSAVGDELVIQHPTETLLDRGARRGRRRAGDLPRRPRPLPAGDGGHAEQAAARRRDRVRAVGFLGLVVPALVVAALLVVVLVAIIGSEHASGRGGAQRGEPSPLQKLDVVELYGTQRSASGVTWSSWVAERAPCSAR